MARLATEKDMSKAAQRRHEMFVVNHERLQHFAFRAQSIHNQSNEQVVLMCIKVDGYWRPLVDDLAPNEDWQRFRDNGQEPVLRGTAYFPVCKVIAETHPDLEEVLMEKPNDGTYKCIVLDEGGCTVYDIEPIEQVG